VLYENEEDDSAEIPFQITEAQQDKIETLAEISEESIII
jgi:hypothetical protein